MRDRALLAFGLALVCTVVLVVGLRRKPVAAVGTLQVDDLGRPFWNGSAARLTQWQRQERSVWIQLAPERSESGASAPARERLINLTLSAADTSSDAWAALHRWLVWLERGRTE